MSRLCYQGEQFCWTKAVSDFVRHHPLFSGDARLLGGPLKEAACLRLQCGGDLHLLELHERQEGKFDFSGGLDVARFVQTAQKLGLYVILRPGPYICAEMDFSGLPSWLLNRPGLALRCNNPLFLQKVAAYYKQLFDRLRPYLGENGGNIIAVQVETSTAATATIRITCGRWRKSIGTTGSTSSSLLPTDRISLWLSRCNQEKKGKAQSRRNRRLCQEMFVE